MADDQDEFANFKHNLTNKESARFLKRVLQKADEERRGKFKTTTERVAAFTGLDEDIFADESMENYEVKECIDLDRTCIHEQLMHCYLVKKTVPTTKSLYRSLYGKIPGHLDIRSFRKYLARMGYIWIKMSNGFVVTERPAVTFERYYYLRDMLKYRRENRDIFYVDETVFDVDTGEYFDVNHYNRLCKIAEKTDIEIVQENLLKNMYAVSKAGFLATKIDSRIKNFTTDIFESWMLDELLPVLPSNSVVVIKNREHHGETVFKPNVYTIKAEMMDWLDHNRVPYDQGMSKSQLLTLIETYTSDNHKVNRLDEVFKTKGHTLVRLPFTAEHLTMARHVFDLINFNATGRKDDPSSVPLPKMIDTISDPQVLSPYHNNVCELEKQTFVVDMKVDKILDDLLEKMAISNIEDGADSEIPLSDSD